MKFFKFVTLNLFQGLSNGKILKPVQNDKGFSLAELLITLIIVSCILAAFAPVITKRMANGGVSIGGSGPAQQVDANVTIEGLTDVCDNPDCKLCIANACLICGIECPPPLSRDYKQCRCVDCSPFDAHCAECNATQCKKCATGYRMVNNHCESCENLPDGQYCDGTGQVQTCPKGSYCINGVVNQCEENTFTNKTGQSECTPCGTGKYAAPGATECIPCKSAYGSYCEECNAKSCQVCKAGYVVSGKQCIEEDASILGYNGLYIYKYNAGDEGGPEIPDTVKVVNAGQSCSGKCCWKATTTNTAADNCTTSGNGSSTYSGCKRTVCNYNAAVDICSAIGWRLPKYNEAVQWYKISANLGKAGLQLCDQSSANYGNVLCAYVNSRCTGGSDAYCRPGFFWGDQSYYIRLTNGIINYGDWTGYTYALSVRCVKNDYDLPEGCAIANSDGNCRKCNPGYILNDGQCEYGLEKGLAMRYNGLFITKYNAGDEDGAPIPSSVTVVEAGVSCSGKCCYKAGVNKTATDSCTSTGNGDSTYSGCNRTVCNYKAAVDICAQIPGGNWRLPTYSEGAQWFQASSGLGKSGLQLCDQSSANHKNVLCSQVDARCYGGNDNYCKPGFFWGDQSYYIRLTNGIINYGDWTGYVYTGGVRCVKTDPDFPEGCLIAHPTITDRCTKCKPGYTLSAGKCTYNLEKSYSMRYNGLYINKYNAGDEGGVPIPSTVTLVEAGTSCTGKCCWRSGVNKTSADTCTSTGNGDSTYSGCNRTVCNYKAAVDICSQAPGGNWRLPTYSEAIKWNTISAGYGKSGLQLCDNASANYGNPLCPYVDARCYGGNDNYCRPAFFWGDSSYYIRLTNGAMSYGDWTGYVYTAGVRCVKPDSNFPAGCLIADENITNKCLTCKLGYTLRNGTCTYDLETDEKAFRYNGLIINKYNAGDEGGAPIPDTVRIMQTGQSCTGKCCWRATSSKSAADTCTTSGNGNSTYGGCYRTVCNWAAASDICLQIPGGGWRLPTYKEGAQWFPVSSALGKSGLQLCDQSSANYGNVLCPYVDARCYGGNDNYCRPGFFWGESNYYIRLTGGVINYGDWTGYVYTAGVRCVKPDVNAIEGCLVSNEEGKCTQCKSGYVVKNGGCEYSPAYLEYNGLKITKYNAGDLIGPPIPNTVTLVDAGVSCSGKCCWRAGSKNTAADGCTSNYGANTDYSGCNRTVCNWSAASEICASMPDGGWRLPIASELEVIKNGLEVINTGKGKDGLQLCDGSNASSGVVYCPQNSTSCPGSTDTYCRPHFIWGESTYYWRVAAGVLSYANWSNAGYAASVRCVK